MAGAATYLTPEARARIEIDKMLELAGWVVQEPDAVNLAAGRGVAIKEFILEPPHGRADYLLFVDRRPVGVLEAKPAGTVLVNVEPQRDDYADGIPDDLDAPIEPIPFLYISTGSRRASRTCSIRIRALGMCSRSTGPRRSLPGSRGTTTGP